MSENSTAKHKLTITYTIIFIVLAILVALWIVMSKPAPETTQPIPIPTTPLEFSPTPLITLLPTPTQTPTFPPPSPESTPNLPRLNESDTHVKQSLAESNSSQILRLVTNEEIIRKVVRAVYQLSLGNVVKQFRPVQSPQGKFLASNLGKPKKEEQQKYTVQNKNFSRYLIYIEAIEALGPNLAADLYKLYQPLLEQAFEELGLGDGSFQQTLNKAIDIMLATPDVNDDFVLTKPTVMYKFSDPDLEKLPNAQKLLIRIGNENRTKFLRFLQEFKLKINHE